MSLERCNRRGQLLLRRLRELSLQFLDQVLVGVKRRGFPLRRGNVVPQFGEVGVEDLFQKVTLGNGEVEGSCRSPLAIG